MTSEFADRLVLVVDGPDVQLVVIATRRQLLLVEGPLEAAYLLFMTLQASKEVVLLPKISL
jgi:hypothetical protein